MRREGGLLSSALFGGLTWSCIVWTDQLGLWVTGCVNKYNSWVTLLRDSSHTSHCLMTCESSTLWCRSCAERAHSRRSVAPKSEPLISRTPRVLISRDLAKMFSIYVMTDASSAHSDAPSAPPYRCSSPHLYATLQWQQMLLMWVGHEEAETSPGWTFKRMFGFQISYSLSRAEFKTSSGLKGLI